MSVILVIGFILVLHICWKGAEEEMKKENWLSHWFDKK